MHSDRMEFKINTYVFYSIQIWLKNGGYPYRSHMLVKLILQTLLERRNLFDASLVLKLIRGPIDSPNLLVLIRFNGFKYHLRSFELLNISCHKINFESHPPLKRRLH